MTEAQAIEKKVEDLDVLCLGEAVIDLISVHKVESLVSAGEFGRFLGGQVTNVALNVARLGGKAGLAACVGDDGFGFFIRRQLTAAGVNVDCLQVTGSAPTTTIVPSRQTGTPDFIAFRGGDAFLSLTPAVDELIRRSRLVHTSAFALSRDPARSAILSALYAAKSGGSRISFDPNFHPRIWPDVDNLPELLAKTYGLVDIVKPSLDDCRRLFGAGESPMDYAARFLRLGVGVVAITLGREGALVATGEGRMFQILPRLVDVVDVTGAGDAFWGGFLVALLDGLEPEDAACVGSLVAEIKIQAVGPVPGPLDRKALYRTLEVEKQHMIVALQ